MILYAEGWDDGVMRGTPLTNFADFPTVVTTQQVTGTRSLGCVTTNVTRSSYYQVSWGADLTTGWLYCAMRPNSAVITTAVVYLNDNATTHLHLVRHADGRFGIYRFSGTLLGTGSFVSAVDTWVHLAMKWTIHDTTGAFELRINGSSTPDILLANVDTRNGANAWVNNAFVGVVTTTNGGANYVDDLIIQDATGSAPENTWLSQPEVLYIFPTASGDISGFTIGGTSPAATRWESLDEVPYDDGTTLVSSQVSGDSLLMNYGISSGGEIYAVIPGVRARKLNAGSRDFRTLHSGAAAPVVSGDPTALSTSWASYYPEAFHRDPNGNPWTTAVVSGAQFGFEIAN